MHRYVHCSIIYNSQDMMHLKCSSTDGWIKKMWYIYIYNLILLSHKKEWSLAICDNMVGPRGYYAKWNKSNWERQTLYDFTHYVESKKQNKWTNITKKNQSYRYREQTGGCQRWRGWGGMERTWWGWVTGTNFQLQNKWVTGMKCTVWGIVNNYVISIYSERW